MAAAREAIKDKTSLPALNRAFYEKLLGFLAEQVSAADVVSAAGKSRRNQIMAYFAIGCTCLAEGKRDEAREQFQKALATGTFYYVEYDWSLAFLKRMEKDPNWPRSIQAKE